MRWAFEFVEVGMQVAGVRVLEGLSFRGRAGETVALVGPAGVGKTVAFRLAVGLERADHGAVIVAGRDLARSSARARRAHQRRLAVVFQSTDADGAYGLFAAATVLENVTFGMRAAAHVPGRHVEATAWAALERFDLQGVAHARPDALPRDARKRLAVARALAIRAPLLVIDALEDGLAPPSLTLVLDALHDLREDGAAVLLTTREAQVARACAAAVVELAPHDRSRSDYRSPSALMRR